MPVSFQNIPANWKVPLYWVEVDASMAGLPLLRQPALLTGIMIDEGDATPDVPVVIGSQAQADARFGEGSELSRMFRAFYKCNFANEVWGCGVVEPASAVAASATIAITTPAVEAGTIHLFIGSDHVPVNIGSNDSADEIANAIAEAINDAGHLPVVASSSGLPFVRGAPQVTGAPEVGGALNTTNGTWTNSPTSYSYAWQRDGIPISGATAQSYTLASDDEDTMIHVIVTATNAAGSGTAPSNEVGPIDPEGGRLQPPENVTAPVVSEATMRMAARRRVRERRSAAASDVTLTCKWKGMSGNDIRLNINHFGRVGGQVTPPGLVMSIPASLSGGTGVPGFEKTIDNLGESAFEYVAVPYTDAASLREWEAEFGFTDRGRWGWQRQLFGHVFSARRGKLNDLMEFSEERNSPVLSVMGVEEAALSPVYEWAAAYTAMAQRGLTNDPARPLQTLALHGIIMAPQHLRFKLPDINTLAHHGIATQFKSDDNQTPMIARESTTYQLNLYGFTDDAYELVTTLATLARLIRSQRAAITKKFPRHKLANDGTRYGTGQAIVTPGVIKGELVAQYRQDEFAALVENTRIFKNHLLVERDPNDHNRINVVYPPDLVNQLRLFAVLAQFRLQYDRGIDADIIAGITGGATGIAA